MSDIPEEQERHHLQAMYPHKEIEIDMLLTLKQILKEIKK